MLYNELDNVFEALTFSFETKFVCYTYIVIKTN